MGWALAVLLVVGFVAYLLWRDSSEPEEPYDPEEVMRLRLDQHRKSGIGSPNGLNGSVNGIVQYLDLVDEIGKGSRIVLLTSLFLFRDVGQLVQEGIRIAVGHFCNAHLSRNGRAAFQHPVNV